MQAWKQAWVQMFPCWHHQVGKNKCFQVGIFKHFSLHFEFLFRQSHRFHPPAFSPFFHKLKILFYFFLFLFIGVGVKGKNEVPKKKEIRLKRLRFKTLNFKREKKTQRKTFYIFFWRAPSNGHYGILNGTEIGHIPFLRWKIFT